MGEEFGSKTPFLFFCDFEKSLAEAVTAGRRNEFARFDDPSGRAAIPDPNVPATFEASRLDWGVIAQPDHREWLRFYRELLKLRCRHIVSHLYSGCTFSADYKILGNASLTTHWEFADRSKLSLLANLGTTSLSGLAHPSGQIIYASEETRDALKEGTLPAWSVVWALEL